MSVAIERGGRWYSWLEPVVGVENAAGGYLIALAGAHLKAVGLSPDRDDWPSWWRQGHEHWTGPATRPSTVGVA